MPANCQVSSAFTETTGCRTAGDLK